MKLQASGFDRDHVAEIDHADLLRPSSVVPHSGRPERDTNNFETTPALRFQSFSPG
jgi:hypothetical protein